MPKSRKPSKKTYNRRRKVVRRRSKTLLGRKPYNAFDGPRTQNPLAMIKAQRNWLGESKRVLLKYCETIQLQSQTLLTAMGTPYYFAINDVFDPNFTGTGHQPRGFDQIAVLFKKYRVFGCRVAATFINPTTTTMWVGSHLLNSQQAVYTAGTSYDYVNEVVGTQTTKIPADTQQVDYDSGYVSIPALEGMSFLQWIADDGFDANVTGDPAAISKIGFFAGDWAGPGAVSAVTAVITMEFDVKFYSAATQATS